MKLLLTGASGFVGGHTLDHLMKQSGIDLIAACRDLDRIHRSGGFDIKQGDLRDPNYVKSILRGVDVVCHTAAWTSLFGHKTQSDARFLQPTLRLLETAREAGIGRFVFISTTSAAAPDASPDPMSQGIKRAFWPHLCNVVKIENRMRQLANDDFTTVNLRLGLFAGERYNLGLLPILLPRLKTHLVPWVNGGRTQMPIIDGRDIGQAVSLAATEEHLSGYESFNLIGPEIPTVREVISHLHRRHGYPQPHFNVPFGLAYPFAWLMEKLDPVMPFEPLVTRSIIHLLENTGADNERAREILGYQPQHHWSDAVDRQLAEMRGRQKTPMPMHVPLQ